MINSEYSILKKVNYLHYGNGLDSLVSIIDRIVDINNKDDLIDFIIRKYHISKFAIDILKSYKGEYNKSIDVNSFKSDLFASMGYQKFFNNLNCRGFSYILSDRFDFSYKLDSSINFKFALLTEKYLYYPPRLRKYLPRQYKNHIIENNYPSIAFALGRIADNNLFVLVMQSDLIFKGPACIREYIKGWRKVLFAEIISFMKGKVENIYLCTADEIVKTCHPGYPCPNETPDIWFQIYDKTAMLFNMKLIQLDVLINMQTLHDLPQEYTKNMYHLNL